MRIRPKTQRDMIPVIKHYTSHERLVPSLNAPAARGRSGEARLEAIVVPSARPAHHLAAAIELAAAIDCWLVLMVSGAASLRDVRELAASSSPCKVMVISLPRGDDHELVTLAMSAHHGASRAHRGRTSDLSRKRNIGLVLARLVGWANIFFMDDDIRGAQPDDLVRATSYLGAYRCVGFSISHFPDNSVVSHARRLGNEEHPGMCIGGSALGVSIGPETDFFPDIYNEDLFFLLDHIERGAVLHAGSLAQIVYNPFDRPDRAASEEFGEVLMEGLLALIHEGSGISQAATDDYWVEFLDLRESHITEIVETLQRSDGRTYRSAVDSLRAAAAALRQISPITCSSYISQWQDRRQEWLRGFRALPTGLALSTALDSLHLSHCEILGSDRVAAL